MILFTNHIDLGAKVISTTYTTKIVRGDILQDLVTEHEREEPPLK